MFIPWLTEIIPVFKYTFTTQNRCFISSGFSPFGNTSFSEKDYNFFRCVYFRSKKLMSDFLNSCKPPRAILIESKFQSKLCLSHRQIPQKTLLQFYLLDLRGSGTLSMVLISVCLTSASSKSQEKIKILFYHCILSWTRKTYFLWWLMAN